MLHGDISNTRGIMFGFRCENSFLRYKNKTTFDKLLNMIMGKEENANIDWGIYSALYHLCWNSNYVPALVVDKSNHTGRLDKFLSEMPFNVYIIEITSLSEITMKLNVGDMAYYIDECRETRELVNSKYAITLDKFNSIYKREYAGR